MKMFGLHQKCVFSGVKIDSSTLKLFSKVQMEDKLGKSLFICKKKFLMADSSSKSWPFGLFGATSALQDGLTPHVIHWAV